ncbi:hypothetical protein KP803_11250 [Vibrio sp. ZSDE26]|uniref:Uncharacterized protein n=1 Tax=Vibrio amylolyticus TaxID=2847292 RepID=A0A9X1XMT3_9VIBR|nr:radial spoke RSP3 family protein [Vibrio amylolyticus]MCK6263845.1 hypothetical protein [Vibrio amylolyticus]
MSSIEAFGGIINVVLVASFVMLVGILMLATFSVKTRSRREERQFEMSMVKEQTELQLREQQAKFEQQQASEEAELQRMRLELEFPNALKLKKEQSSSPENQESKSQDQQSGFFFIPIDEDIKGTFSDMLKGFEDYARLLGYEVSLSIDSSISNQIGYKFSLRPGEQFHSHNEIQKNITEYLKAMTHTRKGFSAPPDADPIHSDNASTTMQKLKTLKRQVNDLKQQRDLYQNLSQSLGQAFTTNTPQIYITQQQLLGNKMSEDNRSYSADNSSGVIQGDNSGNVIESSNVQIGKNVSEVNEQATALQELISALKDEEKPELAPAIRHFENAHEELVEEGNPDPSRVEKYLGKATDIVKSVGVAADTALKLSKVTELLSTVAV